MKPHFYPLVILLAGATLSVQAELKFQAVSSPPSAASLAAVAYDGQSNLVAVGTGATVRGTLATNGLQWASLPLPATEPVADLLSVAYGSNKFVASGTNAWVFTIATEEAWNWTKEVNDAWPIKASIAGLAFNDGTFAAAPRIVGMTRSTDLARSWTNGVLVDANDNANAVAVESFRAVIPFGVEEGIGFVACGIRGDVRFSRDGGRTWMGPFTPANLTQPDLNGIAWDGGSTLVGVGKAYDADVGAIWRSTDGGTNWGPVALPAGHTEILYGIAYSGPTHGFIAVGANGLILTSLTGAEPWTVRTVSSGPAARLRGVVAGTVGDLKGVMALVGDGGEIVIGGDIPAQPTAAVGATTYAGYTAPIQVTVPQFVTVDWFDTPTGGTHLPNGYGTNVYVHPAQPNWTNSNQAVTNTFYAQARDTRTMFTNENRTEVILTVRPRPTSTLISEDLTKCNDGVAYEVQARLTGLNPWTVTWWDGAKSNVVTSPAVRTVYPANSNAPRITEFTYYVEHVVDQYTNKVGDRDFALFPEDIQGTNTVILDPVFPVARCKPFTAQLDATGKVTITPDDVDGGSTDDCRIIERKVWPDSFDCRHVGPNTVTLTVTDSNFNVSTCETVVTVEDKVAPVARCQDITVDLDAAGNVTITPAQVDNGSADACGIKSLSLDRTAFTCANVGPNPVVLTVTDINNNVSTCSATVTVLDNVAPVARCQDITVELDATGNVTITPAQVDNGSADACGIKSLSLDKTAFTCADVGAPVPVVLTVTDINNNVSTCTATVTVLDKVAPVAKSRNIAVELDATGNVTIVVAQVDDGSTDACGIKSLSLDKTAFTCAQVGPNAVVLTVTDINDNVSTTPATVTVLDKVAPVAKSRNITVELDATGNVTITAAQVDDGSTDACGIKSLSLDKTAFTCADVGAPVPVVLTVTDNNDNVSTSPATVTVLDNVAPVARCKDLTVELDASGNVIITAAQVDDGSTDACGIKSLSLDKTAFTCADVGAPVSVVLTVTDNNDNVSTCSAIVTVLDKVAPVARCKDLTVELDATGNVTITAAQVDNVSTDACGIKGLSLDRTAFTCADVGPNPVVLTVTDNNNNVSTCSATVTVLDKVAPVARCKDITVELDATGNVTIAPSQVDNGSSDACGIKSLSLDKTAFTCAQVGPSVVVLTVTDNSDNVSTCSASVTVLDKVAPVAKSKNITVELDATGSVTITAAQVDDGSSDACGIKSLSLDKTAFTCAQVGPNPVVLTVTDNNDNVSTSSATVTVEDNVAPDAKCKDITVELGLSGTITITAAQVDNGSTDACGIKTLKVTPDTFTDANFGTNTVTLTVTDNNDVTADCPAKVVVVPQLVISVSGSQVTLQWFGNHTLQSTATMPPSTWTDVLTGTAGAVNTYNVPAGPGPLYFRLKGP